MQTNGRCNPAFEAVRDAFAANFDAGLELGASVAVTVDGEPVVDLWAGLASKDGRPWVEDTIVNVYSSTKTMAALCVLMLADRGKLDLDAPVATYWPEFAQNGKGGVLVTPRDEPLRRPPRLRPAAGSGRSLRLEEVLRQPRRTGAVVGARHCRRLPRDHAGIPAGRARPARRRPHARHVLPRGSRRPARRRLPHRPRCQTRWPRRRTRAAGAPAGGGLRDRYPGRPAHG